MSIDISSKNEARLKATAQAEGVSVDAYIERLLEEREELAAIVTRSAERMPNLSKQEASAKIERGFLTRTLGASSTQTLCSSSAKGPERTEWPWLVSSAGGETQKKGGAKGRLLHQGDWGQG